MGVGDGAERDGRGARARRRERQADLRRLPFPVVTAADWQDPAAAIDALYRRADATATSVIEWYLADKRGKKRWSRVLRALAIALVAAGGLQPLLDAATPGRGPAAWGFVLLALAATCVGFDRFFGLSSAWMRHMLTVQAVQRRLERFHHDWATVSFQDAQQATPDTAWVERRLDLLGDFHEDLAALIEWETTEWVSEFQTNLTQSEWVSELHRTLSQVERSRADRPPGAARPLDHPARLTRAASGNAEIVDNRRPRRQAPPEPGRQPAEPTSGP
jgi:hypothetical protein